MTGSYNIFPITLNQCVILSYILLSWRFQSTALIFLKLSFRWRFSNALSQFLPKGLIASSVVERRHAIINASERIYLIEIRYPILDIRIKYLARAFSSTEVRYYWRYALSSFEGRPCARYHTVKRGTPPHPTRAAYILGSSVGKSSASIWLARSMLTYFGWWWWERERVRGSSRQQWRSERPALGNKGNRARGCPWTLLETCVTPRLSSV
jgi:hypothetical protein